MTDEESDIPPYTFDTIMMVFGYLFAWLLACGVVLASVFVMLYGG